MKTVVFVISLLFTGYINAQYFPPKGTWESRNPKEFKVNEERMSRAIAFAEANEYKGSRDLRVAILESFANEPYHDLAGPVKERGGPAGLIIKNGYIIAQWGDPSRVDMTFSVTKSYLSAVTGLAVANGNINSVNDRVVSYVWDDTFEGAHNAKVTWEHLLHQNSDWYGSLFGMYDWADRPPREGDVSTWSRRPLNEPGTFFKYNDVRINVLSYSLLQVIRKPLPAYFKEHIMDPIGASDTWRWYGYENSFVNIDGLMVQSVSGGGHHGGGVFVNTYDHARFGLLFMNHGKWAGKQILPGEWIDMSVRPSSTNPKYGYLWWLNRGENSWQGVGDHVYYASGFGGNFIIIDEKNRWVVVTRWLEPSKLKEFMEILGPAL